jgi:Zn-finger nucleic acid-binding protein
MEPHRESPRCPACRDVPLREFRGRLVCDACEGIFLPAGDVVDAIRDLTGQEVALGFIDERPSARWCPRCHAALIACRLRIEIDEKVPTLKPEIDRCIADGIWFDAEELADVLAKLRRVISAGQGGTGGAVAINGRGWGNGWPL